MLAVHEHFRLDDGDQTGFLRQGSIASQRMRIGFNTAPARNGIADGNNRAPLGKTGTHLRVLSQAGAQSIQALGYFLTWVTSHIFRAGVNLDTWHDTRIGYDFNKRSTIFPGLTDGLIIKDDATDKLTQTRSGHNQFPVRTAGFFSLRNPQPGKSFVAGWITFIHRQ